MSCSKRMSVFWLVVLCTMLPVLSRCVRELKRLAAELLFTELPRNKRGLERLRTELLFVACVEFCFTVLPCKMRGLKRLEAEVVEWCEVAAVDVIEVRVGVDA